MGFEFLKRNAKDKMVRPIDRNDIILWRRKYLRLISQYRAQKICYLGETWVNDGHTKSKAWVNTTIKTKKHAFHRIEKSSETEFELPESDIDVD